MRVLEVREPFGIDALSFATRPDPVPGPREVVVRIEALAFNYRDRLIVEGRWRPPVPRIPVSDGAGTIVAAGSEVTRVKVGDRVAPIFYPHWIDGGPDLEKMDGALGGRMADGLYAEYAAVGEESLVLVPPHLTAVEAATLPCAAVTVWNAFAEGTAVREGNTVLVLGTGGVALFAIQFAKVFGARVIVTSSSDEKLERARALGADGTVNYRTTSDWPAAVRALTGGHGADLVIETAGTLDRSIDAVRAGGAVAFIGFVASTRAEIDLISFMGKSATIRSIDVGSRAMFEAMNRAIDAAKLRPVVDRTFAFDEAKDAFRYFAEGANFGKVCVRV